MSNNTDFNRQVRRTASLTFAQVGFIVFGVLVLARGDWLPGVIIIAAAIVGLVMQVPVIHKLCRQRPAPSPPKSKAAH